MKKLRRKYDEVNYWESMADSMVGLLLCVLLILLLLILYLVSIPEEEYKDLYGGDHYESYQDPDAGGGNHNNGNVDDEQGDDWDNDDGHDDNGGAGGAGGSAGGAGGDGDDAANEFDDPDSGAGQGDGSDRAAVFVQLMDSETGRTIKKKGIEFELYNDKEALQVLSTYYPKKLDYSKYETDEKGTFYLPERIPLLSYRLHGKTALKGYDTITNTEFTLDRSYDWNDPYVVEVKISPSKNRIQLSLSDKGDGKAVSGASFEVLAAEDIVTQDGTTRYRQNTIVDTIKVDEKGKGKSKELYLGEYVLRQKKVPQYYGKIRGDQAVSVLSKGEKEIPASIELQEDKTSMTVKLVDALYDTEGISDAEFQLKNQEGKILRSYKTDVKGRFTITDLKKNKTYQLEQNTSVGDYMLDPAAHDIVITADGLIDGEVKQTMTVKNRLIRISIGLQDKLFRSQVSDTNITLLDFHGKAVKSWDTSGMEQIIEGLDPGDYQVMIAGDKEGAQTITVEDKTDIQAFHFSRWTPADFGSIGGAGLFAIGLSAGLILLIRKRRAEKKFRKG